MRLLGLLLIFQCGLTLGQETEPADPVVASASDEGQQAITNFRFNPSWKAELVAAEPMVANPVAFAIDAQGRMFVCETFRQEVGVTDNRSHDETWVDHDLAAQTVEDRIAYHRKLLPDAGAAYTQQDDRIRLLTDTNGDGIVDRAQVFANRFNALEDGTAAGVLPLEDGVLVTCIPHLWLLQDRDHDGEADERKILHSGFGVRVAFRGHDMHGLIRGPDGRIYFSIGDRGYHVTTPDGRVLANPDSGAVFRCEVDGSRLEVFATGLRNPQELAFDQYGNLFTGDNNSDSGDKARWVYVVEGGDSGWRMSYQYLSDRGPFNREKIWHPAHPEQPAYIVPPVANIGDGPSGLAYYPGTGFAEGFQNHFFLCDFRGTAGNSGIRAIQVKPKGAFFEIAATREPLWQVLATDLAFGPDGYLYLSDWVEGWTGEGKGRIYRFADPTFLQLPEIAEVQRILNEGLRARELSYLASLLNHRDQRVRLEAQFELVRRNARPVLEDALDRKNNLLQRLHAMWGLEQMARTQGQPALIRVVISMLSDDEVEIRAHSARILGELGLTDAESPLIGKLSDSSARVRAAAAISLGKLHSRRAVEPLIAVLADNADLDPVLRHAAMMGLCGSVPEQILGQTNGHTSVAVRRAAVVALRRLRSALVVQFLDDESVLVAEEAARAIHDVPIDDAAGALADCYARYPSSIAFTHRALNAGYRIGDKAAAARLVSVATDSRFDSVLRSEALDMLADWSSPSSRDRVLGMWRPIGRRSDEPAARALADKVEEIIATKDDRLIDVALQSIASLRIASAAGSVQRLLEDTSKSNMIRARSMSTLASLAPSNLAQIASAALNDASAEVRIAAARACVATAPESAIRAITTGLGSTDLRERQAVIGLIRELPFVSAEPLLLQMLERLSRGDIPEDTRLDVVESAQFFAAESKTVSKLVSEYERAAGSDVIARYRDCLAGGDAERGRLIFNQRVQVSCLRCHRIGDQGGAVGPDLSEIGAKKDRPYLLESLVDPNRTIAENFETVVIINDQGKTISGILQAENSDFLRLTTAEGNLVTVDKSTIDERRRGKSAMPEDTLKYLSPRDIRDLVEFLAQQIPPPASGANQPSVVPVETKAGKQPVK